MRNNVPEIRFAGFEGEWEESILEKYVEDYIEKTTLLNQYPVLTSSQKLGIVYQKDYFADRQVTTENNIGYYVLPKGYFTFRSRSDNGIFRFNRNDIADKGIISYFYPVFKIINGDSNFFLAMLNETTVKQAYIEAEGTGQKVLSLKKFKNIKSFLPTKDEQTRIGDFFSKLDAAIATQQQELESLKQTKQGFLQKMFPRDGETVPELRFAGFSGAWEEKKLEEVCDNFKSGRILSSDYICNEEKYPVYGGNGLRGYTENYTHDGYYILVGRQGALCGNVCYANGQFYATEHAIVIRANVNNCTEFLKHLLIKMNLNQYSTQSAQPGLAVNKLETLIERFPSLPEQTLIGDFFKNLDDLIALHQQELEALQQTKKAFLQKMFI